MQNLTCIDFYKSGDDLPEVVIMSELLRRGAEVNHADKLVSFNQTRGSIIYYVKAVALHC